MKQLHTLPDGKLVLIDAIGEEPKEPTNDSQISFEMYVLNHAEWGAKGLQALKSAIPTLERDRSTWLELSEKCGGKLEEGKDFKMYIDWDSLDTVKHIPVVLYAIPTPQTEDLSMKWVRFDECIPDDLDNVIVRRIGNKQILSGHIWKLHSYYIETTIESGLGDILLNDAEWLFEPNLTRK